MTRVMRIFLVLSLVGLLPQIAAAQAVDKWTLRIYNVGAIAPLSPPTDLLAAQVVCNQAAPAATVSTINPTRVVFDDPALVGRVCIWTDAGTGPIASLPFGAVAYEATTTATNSVATSAESARAPFTRPGLAPGVPTGLRLLR